VVRFYTGRGDDGTTDLLGERVAKDDARIEVLGVLDEATSSIGMARALVATERLDADLITVQRDLYAMMAELAFVDELRPERFRFAAERVRWLEETSDALAGMVNLAPEFVLPGGSASGAALDVARTTVRTAERRAVSLKRVEERLNDAILAYLNRLSSLLFVAARLEDAAGGEGSLKAKPGA
jgi:cob(I)alamin adenosyltransferase